MSKTALPTTLLQAVTYFADEDVALEFAANLRWPDGQQECPKCGSVNEHYFLKSRRVWKCRDCRKQFSFKVGTIFEDSPIKMSKWLPAIWMLVNCRNGISSYELARDLGVTQKTAWFMLHRIRLALKDGDFFKKIGPDAEVEADETYIGGKAVNMHREKRNRVIGGRRGVASKTAVMGLLERPRGAEHSLVRCVAMHDSASKARVRAEIHKNVAPGATLYSDSHPYYHNLGAEGYAHEVVDHAAEYVRGSVHTNGLENFWSLVKRALHGTYVSVEPFHIFRYLDEQTFRFNNRKASDVARFIRAIKGAVSKRLTYHELTGKEAPAL